MTHFERTFILNQPTLLEQAASCKPNEKGEYDLTAAYNKSRQDFRLQMEYRELDRLSMELEKEIQAVKALRMEMEKYKVDFSLSVEDQATKKIKEVLDGIDKLMK